MNYSNPQPFEEMIKQIWNEIDAEIIKDILEQHQKNIEKQYDDAMKGI